MNACRGHDSPKHPSRLPFIRISSFFPRPAVPDSPTPRNGLFPTPSPEAPCTTTHPRAVVSSTEPRIYFAPIYPRQTRHAGCLIAFRAGAAPKEGCDSRSAPPGQWSVPGQDWQEAAHRRGTRPPPSRAITRTAIPRIPRGGPHSLPGEADLGCGTDDVRLWRDGRALG